MSNPIVSALTKLIFRVLETKIDDNWDSILDHVAIICNQNGLDPDDDSDSALRTISSAFAQYVRETDKLDKLWLAKMFGIDSEEDAYFMILQHGNVNWAKRVGSRVRKLQEV
ncbi:hypothetical protein [Marinomonas mediterranea]|jgi:hypothetical protein|uniref:Uncharacterized protein n=1 Tax=Marinomonas mediterranea (strain ATCC 700492 / JCM 21426 / NBRC 103028 / MMB-1) TaxID=717774 RepID=F2JUX0_MARM1|nr:hypothetical protein [Marinomonas mediterranea]ADZ91624.1 hypothetical protein Marme_2386 [Marinomonas mediterranea MMB-1]WCN09583.1 hypothetical protein GV055_11940 [Marinomonas mediterranea]WCN13668.1 hypothetical protein GV054_11980 [Marinomonas mediterranea]WCN17725.1 hypothetical protein GV053_12045 [Marinomonas mediterranea MMB-1]